MTRVIDQAVKSSTDKLNAFERRTARIGKGFAKVGGIMTGAGLTFATAMFGAAKNVATYGDTVLDAAQKTGLGTENYQKLAYAAERCNVSTETFQASIKQLNLKLVEFQDKGLRATTIFRDLNIRTDNVKNTLLDTAKVFASVEDGPGKVAAAMELFGKAGADLIPFLNQGEAGIEALMEQAVKMGLVLDEQAVIAADNFDTTLNDLMSTIKGAGLQIGAVLIPAVQDVVLKIQGVINKVMEWAKANPKLINTILKVVTGLTGFLLVAGPILTAIGGVIAMVGKISSVIGLIASPVGLIIAGIVALVAAFMYFWKTSEKFRNFFIDLWEKLKKAAAVAVERLKKLWESLRPVVMEVFGAIQKFISAIFDGIKQFWDKWGSTIIELFTTYFTILRTIWTTVFEAIWFVVKPIFDSLKKFWDEWGSTIVNIFSTCFGVIWEQIKMFVNVIMGVLKVFLKVLQGDWEGAWDAVKGIFVDVWEGIQNIFKALKPDEWLKPFFVRINNFFYNLRQSFVDFGKNLITGLIDGIKSMFSKVTDTVSGLGNTIKDKFTGFLGIKSPSTIFAEYGSNITKGLTLGIEKGGFETERATEGLAMQVVRSAGITNNTSSVSSIDNSSTGGVTVNYSPTVNVANGGDVQDILAALRQHKAEFIRWIDEAQQNRRRLAFAD